MQASGKPRDMQQAEWSIPLAKQEKLSLAHGAQTIRSGRLTSAVRTGSQNLSTHLKILQSIELRRIVWGSSGMKANYLLWYTPFWLQHSFMSGNAGVNNGLLRTSRTSVKVRSFTEGKLLPKLLYAVIWTQHFGAIRHNPNSWNSSDVVCCGKSTYREFVHREPFQVIDYGWVLISCDLKFHVN